MTAFLSLHDAVAEYVHDGATIALGCDKSGPYASCDPTGPHEAHPHWANRAGVYERLCWEMGFPSSNGNDIHAQSEH